MCTGANDGLVSVDSAKWGDYRATLENVNHLGESGSLLSRVLSAARFIARGALYRRHTGTHSHFHPLVKQTSSAGSASSGTRSRRGPGTTSSSGPSRSIAPSPNNSPMRDSESRAERSGGRARNTYACVCEQTCGEGRSRKEGQGSFGIDSPLVVYFYSSRTPFASTFVLYGTRVSIRYGNPFCVRALDELPGVLRICPRHSRHLFLAFSVLP